MEDKLTKIIKTLTKNGWGHVNEDNIEWVINEIIIDYEDMEKRLKEIRKTLDKSVPL